MAEAIVLTTPITKPSINDFKPARLHIVTYPSAEIVAVLVSTTGELETFIYPSPNTQFDTPDKVTTLINNLNTANLSIRSLWRRLFDRLVADFPERFPGGATVS